MLKQFSLIAVIFIPFHLFAQTSIAYLSSTSDFANPERGFYRYSETRSNNYTVLDQSTLESYRSLHTPPTANYSIYSTLIFRYFFLEDFKNSTISQAYLDNMQLDFNAARLAGVKLIPRFAYTDEVNGSGCSSWICPPYGDASKSWVLTHINQLQALLEANKDVIATVQMGFVGVWGENYYTDFFGDASQPPNYKLMDQNWTDRIEVLNALLNAVPTERMVQVRYPQKKQRAIYGINAPTNSSPLVLAEAFSGSAKARLGFHNDCLMASPDDFGTYTDYGNSSSSSTSDTTNLKPYLANDSQFVVVGGETCDDAYSPQNDCSSTNPLAYAETELERMHFSYLNSQFNNTVNNDWEDNGCMDEIKRRLGYRFELQNGLFSNATQPGQVFDIDIDLKNTGYASPYNERGLELMLRHSSTAEVWYAVLPDDPRFWLAGNTTYTIAETLCIPNEMPLGNYDVLLYLPDPMSNLHTVPEYAIRLANLLPNGSDVWEASTGYNNLGHSITIDNSTNNAACNGEITFTKRSTSLPVELVDFSAQSMQTNILLQWTTKSENNNAGFSLRRSKVNASNFEEIVWKEGQVNTDNELNSYAFIDSKVERNQDYYYQLVQEDLDGTLTYSSIVTAKLDDNKNELANAIHLHPNPVNHSLRIEWDNFPTAIAPSIQLFNVLGDEVFSIQEYIDVIDTSSLPKGIYFVLIHINKDKVVKKIIKN